MSLPLVAATLVVQASQRRQHPTRTCWRERFQVFCRGLVVAFVESTADNVRKMLPVAMHRKRRRHTPQQDLDRRAVRIEGLVQMGELSAGRQALEGASLAPGNRQTLDALQDPQRRPPEPRDPIPRVVLDFVREVPFDLDETKFASNVRPARRGTVAGPSGMTVEHITLVLDNVRDAHLLFSMAEQLSRAHVPLSVTDALRLERMTALQKTSGGVRGIVVGDLLWRLVAKTVAQQMGKAVAATRPHQCHVHEGRDGMHRPCAPGPH